MKTGKYHRLFTLTAVVITIGVLALLVYQQRQVLFELEWHFRLLPALVSFIIYSLTIYTSALIWAWMMNTLGKSVDIRRHLHNYFLANVTKRLPGTVWYIASRAKLYREENIDIKLTSLVSGMELAVMILSGLLVSLAFAVPIIVQYHITPWILVIFFLIGFILLQPRTIAWIFRLLKVQASDFRYRDILRWLATYIAIWIFGGINLFALANIVTVLPFNNLSYIIGSWTIIGVLSSALFFSPSNFGVTEIGLSLLLSQIMPSPVAVVVAILVRVLLIGYEVVWALIWIGWDARTAKSLSQTEHNQ